MTKTCNDKPQKNIIQLIAFKLLYVVALIKYPKIRGDLKYFVRDNYYCKFIQNKYFFKDYFLKKPYKTICYQGEFDQELRYVIPFAYWHHLNGTLKKTISSKDTKELYFFSKNHEEKYDIRIWTETYNYYNVPNMTHSFTFSYKKWKQVPYKEHYKNDIFKFDKPILIIANKYNIEFDQPPINFLDIPTLEKIITTYKEKYQIIYNRPLSTQIVQDNSHTLNLNDYPWLKKNHPDVILMNDLYKKYKGTVVNNFNHLQLMVYANSSHFISIHGGTAVFASCFGGTNIILSDPKWGMESHFGEYKTIIPAISGAKILHAKTKCDVVKYMKEYY